MSGRTASREWSPASSTSPCSARRSSPSAWTSTRYTRRLPGEQSVGPGDRVWLTFRKYHLFDKRSGARLRSYPEPDAAA